MFRRWLWVWGACVLPLVVLLWGRVALTEAQPTAVFDVIINEWSQGSGGAKEWVELLVVNGPRDLRGWDLGDNSPGDLTFAGHALWANVPPGALIVIYNANDPDAVLPPVDTDPSDCLLVVPHNDAALFRGGWPAFANSTANDNPHLRDAAGATVHDYSTAPGTTRRPGASQHVGYTAATAVGVQVVDNWQVGPAGVATPGAGNSSANSAWIAGLCAGSVPDAVDLVVTKGGPARAAAGAPIVYRLSVRNAGAQAAEAVVLTDTLPAGLAYLADDSGLTPARPDAQTLVYALGGLPPGVERAFHLTAAIGADVQGVVVNAAAATTASAEANLANNGSAVETAVSTGGLPPILIDAVLYDGYATNDLDEAVALRNVGASPVDLGGWALSDGGAGRSRLPAGARLEPGGVLWLTRSAAAFARQFGFAPDFELPAWPGYANSGDEVFLFDAEDDLIDALVYGSAPADQPGWRGAPLQPYTVRGVFGSEGQLLYRKRDQATGLPVPDTDSAADWAQDPADVVNGRKVRYPGWDLDEFFFTTQITQTAVLTVAIAPDNAFDAVAAQISAARSSLQIVALTFENLGLAQALVAALQRGVEVTVLLEGAPAGGLPPQGKYVCQLIETAGGQCWFMISDAAASINDRYRFLHAKYIIVDGARVVISSENLSANSMPYDEKSDGTWGRRGVVLITDAPGVVGHLQTLFARDFDPASHLDLFRWERAHPTYGAPPPGFIPKYETGGVTYTVRYPTPSVFQGEFGFEIVHSPENSLRDRDGLLGLVNRAGAGDTVLVQQLQERPYWGATNSNPLDDPNPRLEAYVNAARRGAAVRLLLDAYFDAPGSAVSNAATCGYVNAIAAAERLRLACATANPTGLGIHNKMVLVQINGRGYVHVGSLNGTEQASKGNRELALQVQSDAAYTLLAGMFTRDVTYMAHLPLMLRDFRGRAVHVLISEVLYDPAGADDAEFIELVNPTGQPVDLSGYGLGDAVNMDDFEDLRRFPPGVVLAPGATLVVATSATAFADRFGFAPDFEILDTDPAVPNMIDDPRWGDPATFLQLGNQGDEVILRDPHDRIVDALAYGTGSLPGLVSCPLVAAPNRSLERFPYWRDTDNCAVDFRDWPFPNPGRLP